VLYYRRRNNPFSPEVGLAEIEARMGFPRDYLDFTTWYLMRKGYITRADNSDFTLTAEGVDFVEAQRANIPTLNKLLTDGSAVRTTVPPRAPFSDDDVRVATVHYPETAYETAPTPAAPEQMPTATADDAALVHVTAPANQNDNGFDLNAIRAEAVRNPLSYDLANLTERRNGSDDRRTGQPDTRLTFSRERRRRLADRRNSRVN
jgi:hypothetical protein